MSLLTELIRIKIRQLNTYKIPLFSAFFGQIIQMVMLLYFWTKIYNADIYIY